MKKLMFVAAAIAAGVAVADVTSANVVGYANRTWAEEQDGFAKMVCSQFQTIGVDAKDMTLGSLVPNADWLAEADYVKVFDEETDVAFEAFYLNDESVAFYHDYMHWDWVHVGWYDMNGNDPEFRNCLNDEALPLGCTVMAIAANAGAGLTTSGEVVESETGRIEFLWEEEEDGFAKMIGNCTPVAITLGDFLPNEDWLAEADYVKVFDEETDVAFEAFYLNEESVAFYHNYMHWDWVHVGWYDMNGNDPEFRNCLDGTKLEPGDGVMAIAANAGAGLSIPSAL